MTRILLALLLLAPHPETPLPDRTAFLIEFQVKRPGLYKAFGAMPNYGLASQYTYTEKVIETTLDSKGNPKGSKTSVFEVLPTHFVLFPYRRQIVKDGVPLTPKELEKQDRKHADEVRKVEREVEKTVAEMKARQKGNPNPTPPPPPPRPPAKLEDSDILMAADFQLVRREAVDGHPIIVLTFKPNLTNKPTTEIGKMLQHASGEVWVSETDYELVKLDAQVFDTISFGMGFLAKIQPGSRGLFEWRKFNGEVWLPVREDFTARARILLVKGMNFREVHEYTDHRKYSVDVDVQFKEPVPQ
jgi:hypothetical protein